MNDLKMRIFLEISKRYQPKGLILAEDKKKQAELLQEKQKLDAEFAELEKEWRSLEKSRTSPSKSMASEYSETQRRFIFPKAFSENVYRAIILGQHDPEHPECGRSHQVHESR